MLYDNALVIAMNAVDAVLTHVQLHSSAPSSGSPSTGAVGTRVAVGAALTVDADGDLVFTGPLAFTGLAANQAIAGVSYWSAAGTGNPATGGTSYGYSAIPVGGGNDATANAAGAYTLNTFTETTTAS